MLLFDGNAHARTLDTQLINHINDLKKVGSSISTLAIIQVGDNESSKKYINLKLKLCEKVGVPVILHQFQTDESDFDISSKVKSIFNDHNIGGGIIQLPLPRLSLYSLLDLIPSNKDIDLLSSTSQSQFYEKNFAKLSPVIRAAQFFISQNQLVLEKLKVFVVGEGNLVGKPLAHYLKSFGASVTTILNYERGMSLDCQLLILSAGVPNLVTGADIKADCHVIDFGSAVVAGKVVGDFDISSPTEHLGTLSASPGGMGPLVVRFLLMNHLGL